MRRAAGLGYHGPFKGRLIISDCSGKMFMIRLSDESSHTSKGFMSS